MDVLSYCGRAELHVHSVWLILDRALVFQSQRVLIEQNEKVILLGYQILTRCLKMKRKR